VPTSPAEAVAAAAGTIATTTAVASVAPPNVRVLISLP
jgi:hypothetical protein